MMKNFPKYQRRDDDEEPWLQGAVR